MTYSYVGLLDTAEDILSRVLGVQVRLLSMPLQNTFQITIPPLSDDRSPVEKAIDNAWEINR